ncbi:hypothetical protein C4D60_Mb06t35980 [Musa balbisiana]|uniref:Uncharacterized protein n=1 Tax=Musa balbisiana TaxID=52838 RepID=A0A4S8IT62_MUSBA|nr:hypothetical protein C4D60_Mb06t35980 [Musa balbisiana]
MESRRKVPTLVELCMDTAIANLRYIEDGRDLSPVTDDWWKRFYEQQFGVESANTVINRMKQKKIVFKNWRNRRNCDQQFRELLYEAKQKEREEAKNRMAKKLKQSYAESQARIGPSNSLSNLKSNLMKAAKLEFCNSHEAKVHALMRRNALQRNSLSLTSKHPSFCKTEQYPSKISHGKENCGTYRVPTIYGTLSLSIRFEFYLLTLYYVLWLQVTSLTRLQIRQ